MPENPQAPGKRARYAPRPFDDTAMDTSTLLSTQELAAHVGYVARSASQYVWLKLLYERGHDYVQTGHWKTRTPDIDAALALGRVILEERSDHGYSAALIDTGDALVSVEATRATSTLSVRIGGARDVAATIMERLRELYPKPAGAGDAVPVLFRYNDRCGGDSTSRRIDCPAWAGMAANYATTTRDALNRLHTWSPGAGGRLLLWHGEPGTGKTWALRALAREWSDWCRVEYVTDPEAFLGTTDYLMGALADEDDIDYTDERWRLFVLEDTGELLHADAKEHEGQRLSRLLNLVDGLIGQGMRVLVLVTSNDDVRSVHPAMSRPGRCAMAIEFAAFSVMEANAWLRAQEVNATVGTDTSLASLFALAEGRTPSPPRRRAGFLSE